MAIRSKTGEMVWYYQFTPNEMYDWDANWELILADIDVEGAQRKVLMQLNRNGFLYVLDRTNGILLYRGAEPGAISGGADHQGRRHFCTALLGVSWRPHGRFPDGVRAAQVSARAEAALRHFGQQR
jgi:hypothetical protein